MVPLWKTQLTEDTVQWACVIVLSLSENILHLSISREFDSQMSRWLSMLFDMGCCAAGHQLFAGQIRASLLHLRGSGSGTSELSEMNLVQQVSHRETFVETFVETSCPDSTHQWCFFYFKDVRPEKSSSEMFRNLILRDEIENQRWRMENFEFFQVNFPLFPKWQFYQVKNAPL